MSVGERSCVFACCARVQLLERLVANNGYSFEERKRVLFLFVTAMFCRTSIEGKVAFTKIQPSYILFIPLHQRVEVKGK